MGKLYRKEKNNKFKEYTAILAGGYIYFFESHKAINYTYKEWIKNSEITEIEESLLGMKNVFRVTNSFKDNYFACKTEK